MKYSRNSLLLTAGLFSIAVAIAFHAWWPLYKADRDREEWVFNCVTTMGLLSDEPSLDGAFAMYEGRCTEKFCQTFECRSPY